MSKTAVVMPLDIAEVPFSDLILLSSTKAPNEERLRRVLETVGTELGRGGSGLLAIADVPRMGALRRRLLPLARRLSLMDHPTRTQLLKVTRPFFFRFLKKCNASKLTVGNFRSMVWAATFL